MAVTFEAQIISPDKVLFSGPAEMLACRTKVGEIAFYANHVPLVGALDVCKVRVLGEDGHESVFGVKSGFVEVVNNTVTLLTDMAFPKEEITPELVDKVRSLALSPDSEQDGSDLRMGAIGREESSAGSTSGNTELVGDNMNGISDSADRLVEDRRWLALLEELSGN